MAAKRELGRLKSDLTARGWYCENGAEGELVASIENASRPDAETQIVVWEDGAPEIRGIYQADGVRRQGATMLSPQVFAALRLVEAVVTPRLSTVNLLDLATTNERLLIAFMLEDLDWSVAALERMHESVQARIDRDAAEGQEAFLRSAHAEIEADVEAGLARLAAKAEAAETESLAAAALAAGVSLEELQAMHDEFLEEPFAHDHIDASYGLRPAREACADDSDAYVDQLHDEAVAEAANDRYIQDGELMADASYAAEEAETDARWAAADLPYA